MADVKLNSLATKTNANAAAILVKDSATQNQGAEGWITKAQLIQIIRDEVKAQLSNFDSSTSALTPSTVPSFNSSGVMGSVTLANFAKVVGRQYTTLSGSENLNNITTIGVYMAYSSTETNTIQNVPATGYGMRLEVTPLRGDNTQIMQTVYMLNANLDTYVRRYSGSSWGAWAQITKS